MTKETGENNLNCAKVNDQNVVKDVIKTEQNKLNDILYMSNTGKSENSIENIEIRTDIEEHRDKQNQFKTNAANSAEITKTSMEANKTNNDRNNKLDTVTKHDITQQIDENIHHEQIYDYTNQTNEKKIEDLIKEFSVDIEPVNNINKQSNSTSKKETDKETLKDFYIALNNSNKSITSAVLNTPSLTTENENTLKELIQELNIEIKEAENTTHEETIKHNISKVSIEAKNAYQQERKENRDKLEELIKEFSIDTFDKDNINSPDTSIPYSNPAEPVNCEISQLVVPKLLLNEAQNDVTLMYNTKANAYETNETAIKTTLVDEQVTSLQDVNMLDISDSNNCIIDNAAEAPLVSFNVNFNPDTNKYELVKVQQTNDDEDSIKSLKNTLTAEMVQKSLRSYNENGEFTPNSNTINVNTKINKTNKISNRKKRKKATRFYKIPAKINKGIQVSDDYIKKGFMDLYSEEVVNHNSEKPVMWPPPSLEDSHLDLPSPESRFHCGDCNKRFTTEYDIAMHNCNEQYAMDFTKFNKTLDKRKLSNSDTFKYKIDDDDEPTRRHKPKVPRRGIDIGPYSCHICKKLISRRSGLTVHLRRHNNETPYECEYCKKKFVVLYDLDRHTVNIHLGKKKYRLMCEVCNRPFFSKDGLILHKRKMHCGYASYVCEICQQPFDQEYRLWRHKKTQHEHGNEIKQSNVIEQSLEILEDAENTNKMKTGSVQTETESDIENNSRITQTNDSNVDKGTIELAGLNPLDMELVELNTTDVLNATLDSSANESNDVEVELIDLKQTLMDDSIGMTAFDEAKNAISNENDLDLVDINESILNNMFDDVQKSNMIAPSNEIIDNNLGKETNEHLQYLEPMNSGSTENVKAKSSETIMISNIGIENAVNPSAVENFVEDFEESQVLDESIALMETESNLNAATTSRGTVTQPNLVINRVQLFRFENSYIMNGAQKFVNPLQLQRPVQLISLNQPNVLLFDLRK